ncbi:hypothetical protein [Alkalimarinus sediminis]|uniref:Lipoprotein n=1 Tax=Alkalimarinus sediminis TaxID=1632866 RepID=A0A9E8KKV1_9ALTE|nr:hypothetical protein [Alkalimarinus sediminis]UZW76596.1 hypothetical protein NNL22_08445 [Alkalimarinus sediminis]
MTNKLRLTSITASLLMCMTLVACGGGSGGGVEGSTTPTIEGQEKTTGGAKNAELSEYSQNGVSVKLLTSLLESGVQQYPSVNSSPDGRYVIAAWAQGNQVVIKPDPMADGGIFFNSPITEDRYLSDEISIAVNDNGAAIVAWVEWGNGVNPRILYRTVDIALGIASEVNELDNRLTNVIDAINLSINSNGDGLVTFKGATANESGLMASLFTRATQSWSGANVIDSYTSDVIGQTLDDSGRAMIGFEYFTAKYITYQTGSGWGSVMPIPFDIERKDEASISLGLGSVPTLGYVANNGEFVPDDGISISTYDWSRLNWNTPKIVGESAYQIHEPDLALGADGKLYLTWLAKKSNSGEDNIFVSKQDSNGWSKAVLVTDNPGLFALNIIAQADGKGDFSVMWSNAGALFRQLNIATSIGGKITTETLTDNARAIVDYAQVLNAAGERHIIWSEANYKESVVFMRKDTLN